MEILLIITVSLINIICFLLGARVARGERFKSPAQIIDEREQKKAIKEAVAAAEYEAIRAKEEAEAEARKLETILENMERYDGTSAGQRDL